jgi:hypothetical protein
MPDDETATGYTVEEYRQTGALLLSKNAERVATVALERRDIIVHALMIAAALEARTGKRGGDGNAG